MSHQLNLLSSVTDKAEKHAAQVYAALASGDWMTRRQLERLTGLDDRVIRMVAEQSKGRVISGQSGYRLTKFASVEEIDHAERWLLSQANKMRERAVEIRRARNGRAA